MRLVLDSNVLIAAFIARGLCHEVLQYSIEFHQPQISEFIIGEVTRNLKNKIGLDDPLIAEHRRFLERRFQCVEPQPLAKPACRDEDDDQILALARDSQSKVIITGDPDLLEINIYESIHIVNPRRFWNEFR